MKFSGGGGLSWPSAGTERVLGFSGKVRKLNFVEFDTEPAYVI